MAEFRVLVVGDGTLERKIGEGANQAGALVEYAHEWREGFDLAFIPASEARRGVSGSVALFYARGFLEFGNKMGKAVQVLGNARIANQIILDKKGFFKDKLDEISLERARAFGERTVRNLTGRRFEKHSEKSRISGYRK